MNHTMFTTMQKLRSAGKLRMTRNLNSLILSGLLFSGIGQLSFAAPDVLKDKQPKQTTSSKTVLKQKPSSKVQLPSLQAKEHVKKAKELATKAQEYSKAAQAEMKIVKELLAESKEGAAKEGIGIKPLKNAKNASKMTAEQGKLTA